MSWNPFKLLETLRDRLCPHNKMMIKFQRTTEAEKVREPCYTIILWIPWDQEGLLGRLYLPRSQPLIGFEMTFAWCVWVGMERLNLNFRIKPESKKKKECWQLTLELCKPRSKSWKQRMPTPKVPRSKRKAMIATCRCVWFTIYDIEKYKETHWRQWEWLEWRCKRLLRKARKIERVCTLHAY